MRIDKNQYNILIIEDNQGDFTIVDDFLREQILNPFIIHARNYKQALSILSDRDIVFDVILLDLSLPDKNGQDLITEILRIAPVYPVIVLTGYTDMEFSIKSISQGIYDYLLKDELTAVSLYKSILYSIERKKTITELKNAEKRASNLFNLSPQPMWVYDQETYQFIQVNNAAVEHYGYTIEEFLSMSIMDIRPADEVLSIKAIIKEQKKKNAEIFKGTFIHRKKSGEIIEVEIFSNPISLNNKIYRSVIAVDVTERNLYEQKIMKAIIKTQEDERYEIGGELHDNVCQVLAASQMSLGMLKGAVEASKLHLFHRCTDHLKLVLNEIRNLSHRLAPAFFDDSDLEEAIRRLFKTFNFNEDFEVLLYFDKNIHKQKISLEIQVNMYRILQEQLRNIQKYAHATSIEVDMLIYNNRLKMRISDNGVGFNVSEVKDGIGLANMKRRTELFAGKFEIESSLGEGCVILVDIPLPEHEPICGAKIAGGMVTDLIN